MLHGSPARRKKLLRACIYETELAAHELGAEIPCQIPPPLMKQVVAGARYAAEEKTPGRVVDFNFSRGQLRITRQMGEETVITSVAA